MDYKKAGVDIEAGYRSVELMKEHVKKTMRPEVLGGLGCRTTETTVSSRISSLAERYSTASPTFRRF